LVVGGVRWDLLAARRRMLSIGFERRYGEAELTREAFRVS
jgi:hypothetical protein